MVVRGPAGLAAFPWSGWSGLPFRGLAGNALRRSCRRKIVVLSGRPPPPGYCIKPVTCACGRWLQAHGRPSLLKEGRAVPHLKTSPARNGTSPGKARVNFRGFSVCNPAKFAIAHNPTYAVDRPCKNKDPSEGP